MSIQLRCAEDRSLLDRIERADEQAMGLLYDRHAHAVYSMALRVLCDPDLAEQVLSDIFMEIWRTPDRFMPLTGSFSPAMVILARSRALAAKLHKPAACLDFASQYEVVNQQEWKTTREQARVAIVAL